LKNSLVWLPFATSPRHCLFVDRVCFVTHMSSYWLAPL